MTQQTSQPPPFFVDATYEDERGKYKVLAVKGPRMTFERTDRTRQHTDDMPLKARIHNRIVSEREHPNPLSYQQTKAGSGTSEYTYEHVTPLVAEVIDKHSARSRDYMPHASLQKELLCDPHARSIIEGIPPTPKLRTPEAWAGVIIAGFSKQWPEGRWPRFERKKISRGHAWRVKRS